MKTVRVRIAVAVGPDGEYSCAGWDKPDNDADVMGQAKDLLPGVVSFAAWVEADVPVPEEAVVEGEVSDR